MPLSGLQHLVFCERQFALIHIERVWRDNPLTIEGSHLHGRTHDAGPRREVRGDLVVTRGLPLRSLSLGVSGKADVVEFRRGPASETPGRSSTRSGVRLAGLAGLWSPFPVEYKRGRPKPDRADEVQLCAQAMCLEEMLEVFIPAGALFYGRTQHRHAVSFTPELRRVTEEAAGRVQALMRDGATPRMGWAPKCRRCSLLDVCRPRVTGSSRSARRYLAVAVRETGVEDRGA